MDVEDLKKMTVAELREEAKKLGDVTGLASMKKDDLVELLSGGSPESPGATKAGKSVGASRSELKQKIRALKKQRQEASAHHAKSKVMQFNEELRQYRRWLRRAARHKATSSK